MTVLFRPYWWELASPAPMPRVALQPSYDVGVIGAGLTGLSAAIPLLRAGRSVVLFDREDPGFGASRRNAGFVGRSLKLSLRQIASRRGREFAIGVYRELDEAYQATMRFIEEERIDCYAVRCGRFVGALSAAHLRILETDLESMRELVGLRYRMVSAAEVRSEVATDIYVGGAVIPDLGSLHPGLYHAGLTRIALEAGAAIFSAAEVRAIQQSGRDRHRLMTDVGSTEVRDVIVATNGYTTRGLPWHRRRLVPFTGYMAATEVLPPEVLQEAIPHRRTVLDSNMNIDFFRPAPDQSRMLWGGATASNLRTAEAIEFRLRQILLLTFPQLKEFRTSHVWQGRCAGTFDLMPHCGGTDGIWYAMGYNFAGVPMGSHLGRKLAARILRQPGAASYFESRRFPTLPFYTGNAWFMPAVMRYFDFKDRQIARSLP